MRNTRSIFFLGAILVMALSMNATAQEDAIVVFQEEGTTSQSAVLAAFVASINDGAAASTGISISNVLGAPAGSGFPSGGDEAGPLTIYLFNQIGTTYRFSTAEHPDVGAGLDIEGSLAPGGTYTVNLSEILLALFPDRVPADRNFAGYAWVVADFDAVAGTFFNFFPLAGASQAFQMEPTAGGLAVMVEEGQ